MINFFYYKFITDFINFRYGISSLSVSITKNRMYERIIRHQKMMPKFLSIGIRIVSLLLFFYINIYCLVLRKKKSEIFIKTRKSFFSFFQKVMRFHDSIFDIANNKEEIISSILNNKDFQINENFDFIVIGSGPGGSVAACELLNKNQKVCLLEMGNNEKSNIEPYSYNEMINKYKYGGLTATIGNANISYVEGATIGGGSQINSGLYHRLPGKILEKWITKFKIQGVDSNELKKYYLDIEKKLCVSKFPENKLPTHSLILKKGADILNWEVKEVPRWVNYNDDSLLLGIKMTMVQTYLKEFIKNGGNLLDSTEVLKLSKQKKLWRVDVKKNGKTFNIMTKNVILSAGAIGTPTILKRSNLSSNAGKNLEMHPTIKILAIFDEDINQGKVGVGVHQVSEFNERFTFGCSVSTKPYLKLALQKFPEYQTRVDKEWKKMAIYYVSIISDGKGSIQHLPFTADPTVKYTLTRNDLNNFEDGINKLCNLLFKADAKKIFTGTGDKLDMNSNKLITLSFDHLSNYEISTVHLFSSCPMGENKDLCVVDSFGKVHNQDGLYVSDCSMLPSSTGVNPQGTVMSFAYRNIKKIISEL